MSSKSVFQRITRRRFYDEEAQNLARVLTVYDLIFLGIGSTLGVGIYVLSGQVAQEKAGPAVSISFLIAAVSSIFSGLCYAEFSARVPRAGSAYVYSYVSVGEFIGFTCGWNMVLCYLLGASSVSRGFSGYIDFIANGSISSALQGVMPINTRFLSPYPDFVAFGMVMTFTVILAIGVSESSFVNNILTLVNCAVVLFVIICGAFKVDTNNWFIKSDGTPQIGDGGFFPFGVKGVLSGAATCFYGFVGFDIIATTGEEAKNSRRAIPIAIMVSLMFTFLCYFGISTVLTLMVPYYLQDPFAPLTAAFDYVGWSNAKWIVASGAIFGLTASLIGTLFPLPRVLYAMSCDGLLFPVFSKISERFQTPFYGTIIAGGIAGFFSAILNLEELIDAMSLSTLVAYSVVGSCIMLLRYQPADHYTRRRSSALTLGQSASFSTFCNQVINRSSKTNPTQLSGAIASYLTLFICASLFALAAAITFAMEDLINKENYIIIITTLLSIFIIAAGICLLRQPSKLSEGFQTPLVPFLPIVSIFANFMLILQMNGITWLIYGIYMVTGYLIYFLYGIRNSTEEQLAISRMLDRMKRKEFEGYKNNGYIDSEMIPRSRYGVPEIHVELATPQHSSPTQSLAEVEDKQHPVINPESDYTQFAKTLSESLVKVAIENSAEYISHNENDSKMVENEEQEDSNAANEAKTQQPVIGPEKVAEKEKNSEITNNQEQRNPSKETCPDSNDKPSRKSSKPADLVIIKDPETHPETPPGVTTETNDSAEHKPEIKSANPKPHPKNKFFRTDSGFDIIPPSSPDSPLAKRISNKFVLIPVESDPMKDEVVAMDEKPYEQTDETNKDALQEDEPILVKAECKLPSDQTLSSGDQGAIVSEPSSIKTEPNSNRDCDESVVDPNVISPENEADETKGVEKSPKKSPSITPSNENETPFDSSNTNTPAVPEKDSVETPKATKASVIPPTPTSPPFMKELESYFQKKMKDEPVKIDDKIPPEVSNEGLPHPPPRRKVMRSEDFKKLLEIFSNRPQEAV